MRCSASGPASQRASAPQVVFLHNETTGLDVLKDFPVEVVPYNEAEVHLENSTPQGNLR